MTRRVGSYSAAIQWIADNDDNSWLHDAEFDHGMASVALCLVADVFGRTREQAIIDLKRELTKKGD